MKTESIRRGRFPHALATAALTVAALCAGCTSRPDESTQAAAVTASNVTLSAQQRQHIHLYTVAPSMFSKTVETTGVVDFDNDRPPACWHHSRVRCRGCWFRPATR